MEKANYIPKSNHNKILKTKMKSLDKDIKLLELKINKTEAKMESIKNLQTDLKKNKMLLKQAKQLRNDFRAIINVISEDKVKKMLKELKEEPKKIPDCNTFVRELEIEIELSTLEPKEKRERLMTLKQEDKLKYSKLRDSVTEIFERVDSFCEDLNKTNLTASEKNKYELEAKQVEETVADELAALETAYISFYEVKLKAIDEEIVDQIKKRVNEINCETLENKDTEQKASLSESIKNIDITSETSETSKTSDTSVDIELERLKTEQKTVESKIKKLKNIQQELNEITDEKYDKFDYNSILEAHCLFQTVVEKLKKLEILQKDIKNNQAETEGDEGVQETVYFLIY